VISCFYRLLLESFKEGDMIKTYLKWEVSMTVVVYSTHSKDPLALVHPEAKLICELDFNTLPMFQALSQTLGVGDELIISELVGMSQELFEGLIELRGRGVDITMPSKAKSNLVDLPKPKRRVKDEEGLIERAKTMQEMVDNGMSYRQIARAMNLSPTIVCKDLARLKGLNK